MKFFQITFNKMFLVYFISLVPWEKSVLGTPFSVIAMLAHARNNDEASNGASPKLAYKEDEHAEFIAIY